jgi:Bacterial alpha-L-rhamnosidase C-terminal domain
MLGIRPLSPAYRTWIVAPQLGDLNWAQGAAPTPQGPIASRWRRGSNDSSLKLTVAAPNGTEGVVEVPLLGCARTVAMDGRKVWKKEQPSRDVEAARKGYVVRFEKITGKRTFAWAGCATASGKRGK